MTISDTAKDHTPRGGRFGLWAGLGCGGLAAGLTLMHLELIGFYGETGIASLVGVFLAPAIGVGMIAVGNSRASRSLKLAGVGMLLSAILAFITANLVGASLRPVAEARGDVLAAQLATWHAAHGSYPESLEALVPSLLDRVPITPYGILREHPYRYRLLDEGTEYSLSSPLLGGLMTTRRAASSWKVHD